MRHVRPIQENYFSSEKGSWKKSWTGRLPVALVFPNVYRVGMSNLGFQLVYDMLNSLPDVVCERIFLPDAGDQPLSIESSRPLSDFPVVLASLSFEMDIISLLKILRNGGVEPLAEKRAGFPVDTGSPLVIGGGVACYINPEPLAPFTDMIVLGDAEPALANIIALISEDGLPGGRSDFLYECARSIKGCYVPALYSFSYDGDGHIEKIDVEPEIPEKIPVVHSDRAEMAGCSKILSPSAEFSDLFLVELGRGCSRGCRFCAAGYVYRPPRQWPVEAVLKSLDERPEGVDRVGLLGMEMVHEDDLGKVVEKLLSQGCQLSFSSLRADRLDESLITLLAGSNLKTVALAPDGGSERLRRVINKGISRQDILESAEKATVAGIYNLKLYFMIGLPTETEEDLVEMVELVRDVRKVMDNRGRAKGRLSTLTLSINPFVPKAWTPFQLYPFVNVKELKNKIKFLRLGLKDISNLKIMGEKPENAFLQAVIAKGDRRLAPALLALADNGGNWRHVLRNFGIDPEVYACRESGREEIFPWDIVDHGIKRDYLWSEYRRAHNEKSTEPCNTLKCKKCGCCS